MSGGLVEFYRGKSVFVTGHTGFKGAWLCLWLTQLGCRVTGYALPPDTHTHNLSMLIDLPHRIDSIYGDIRQRTALQDALSRAQPDLVFHLAAQALVLPSYEAPVDTFETNIMGTVNLLECVRQNGRVQVVVNVTTDKCYENNDAGIPFREDDKLGGYDPYSSSKAAAEIVSAAYRRSFLSKSGIAMATARAGNVIGGGDFAAHRLIPDIVRAIEAKQPVSIRHPASTRPWQHVFDALHGYLMLGKALGEQGEAMAEAFNFGPDDAALPVGALAKQFIAVMGSPVAIEAGTDGGHEAAALQLDNRKAKAKLGWQPQLSAEQAVDLTARWYYDYVTRRNDTAAFTEEQLLTYRRKIDACAAN